MQPADDGEGVRIAILIADGFDAEQLDSLWTALDQQGVRGVVTSVSKEPITPGDDRPSRSATVDERLDDAAPERFHGVLVPGGRKSVDRLIAVPAALELVRTIDNAGKPIGALGFGVRILTAARIVFGRGMTGEPSCAEEAVAAGARWFDGPTWIDGNWVTTRGGASLPDFCRAFSMLVTEFQVHRRLSAGRPPGSPQDT